jgi:16S rRNA (guanine1207-N2)-methyltransferase
MATDHYYTAQPSGEFVARPLTVTLAGKPADLQTAGGVFSPGGVDIGTQVLLTHAPAPPPDGDLLDLGCGWGPVALTLALASPRATVWAVDVNERALELTRRNAATLGLENVRVSTPESVPDDVRFTAIWSNPPIRVGKPELHGMLEAWLPRLHVDASAWLVVARHLGSDSLERWLQSRFAATLSVTRATAHKGFRVLRAQHRPPTAL